MSFRTCLSSEGIGIKECGLDLGMVVFVVLNSTRTDFLGGKDNRRIGKMTNAGLHVWDR